MKSRTDKHAWKIALGLLDKYELPDSYRGQRVARAREMIEELLSKGSMGEVSEARFSEIRDALDFHEHRIARDAYFTNVHSCVLTSEWLDSLGRAFQSNTILEIGAGRGCMVMPMHKRGVTWIGVQRDPDKDCFVRPVPVKDYLSALRSYRHKIDYVFMSWPTIKLSDQEIIKVMDASVAYDIPVLLVSERRMSTSCPNEVWDNQYTRGYRVIKSGLQPAQWRGLRDALWLVVNEKRLSEDGYDL